MFKQSECTASLLSEFEISRVQYGMLDLESDYTRAPRLTRVLRVLFVVVALS